MEFYNFLYSMEMVAKKVMRKENIKAIKDGFSMAVARDVPENDDVLFWWWILCSIVNAGNETTETLLPGLLNITL